MELVRQQEHPGQGFSTLLHAQAGQACDTVQLGDDMRRGAQLYGCAAMSRYHQGQTLSMRHAGTVAYELAVTEGAVYRMGELEFRGIDNSLTAGCAPPGRFVRRRV